MAKTVNMPEGIARTLVDVIQWRAANQGDFEVYTFLLDGEEKSETMTFRELDRRARTIAAWLMQQGVAGDRVMMLFPPGLDFMAAFYGCLYANMIAIPLYPHLRPKKDKVLERIEGVVRDAQPLVILHNDVVARVKAGIIEQSEGLGQVPWQNISEISSELAETYAKPRIEADNLAFLQYTSGSTSTPKGVMVSHGNIMANLYQIYMHFGCSADDHTIIWLPPYHDMGLIGGILTPAYSGFRSTFMPPVYFLQRPFRWLKAIAQRGGTISGGPNFAFEYAVKKVRAYQLAQLELSGWRTAFSGAEPINGHTLREFAAHFASCGFSAKNYYPCYGLAEGTLMITGHADRGEPLIETFDAHALEQHRAVPRTEGAETELRTLVGSGTVGPEMDVQIVNPDTLEVCPDGSVGEVWVKGDNIALGYWKRPEQSEETFGARISGTGEGPFMRTGDLGFFYKGELFVTGRIKDLIIIDGSNHYPQDIEWSITDSHPAIKPHGAAAFAVETGSGEKLVVVAEIDRRVMRDMPDVTAEQVSKTIRSAVSNFHDLRIHDLVLTTRRIPKTTSGKIQHHHCKQQYLDGQFQEEDSSQ